MNVTARLVLTLIGTLLFPAAMAQDATDDEADVLLTIEREWEAAQKGDQKAIDNMLTIDFMGWEKTSPAPRSKRSNANWRRFSEQMGRIVRYELYPLSITAMLLSPTISTRPHSRARKATLRWRTAATPMCWSEPKKAGNFSPGTAATTSDCAERSLCGEP